MVDYEKDTLNAYRTETRAIEYKRYQTTEWTWARFVTWFEQKAINRELRRYDWSTSDRLLDIPCGTGILGKILHNFPFEIIASDISAEMLALAREEYPQGNLVDCIEADITKTSFTRESFDCIITLGFMHRVPSEVKQAALKELYELSNGIVVVSSSVDTPIQRIKHSLLSLLKSNHIPAPCPISMSQMIEDCEAQGFRVSRSFMVLPFLSAHAIFVLEKKKIKIKY